MTEFWKSQERKYCDFCKCWITDNKPSVQFHENGKRHKENVAKKISELSKKSAKAQKESKKLDADMKKMEEAAMKAYMKDMESNPDFTSLQYKKNQDEKAALQQEEVKEIVKKTITEVKKLNAKKLWHEAKTDTDYTYYWNIETKESVWEPPKEGYISLEEQQKTSKIQEEQAKQAAIRAEENKVKEATEEARAFANREKMKAFRKEESKEVEEYPGPILGPAPRVDPYGSWSKVENVFQPRINLQLPKAPKIVEVPVAVLYEPKIKIKEKKMGSLEGHDCNASPVFKKRKPNPNRGNIRQRLDDD